jgi:PAS domain S-box-containing protein
MILTIFYYFYLLIKYIKAKVAGARTLLIFIIIIALATINDILYTNEIIHTGEMIGYGLFFFILGQALTIAKVFANAYRENKILLKKLDSHNIILERAVKERTKELSANRNELEKQNNKLKTVIEKLDITNEELQKKNEELLKYFQIINQSPISIVITDIDQNIVYVNPFFEKITGYSKAEVLGKNPKVLNSGKTPPERYKEMYEKLEKGQSWTGEFINKRKNGVIFIEKAIISIIYDSEGNPVNYLGLKEDITELKHKEEEISEKTIMLENLNNELNKALSDLMAGLNYAQRIQRAFLSSEDYIKTMFDEYLLIFKPKEAVGGDAYYFKKLDNLKIIAIIDCTGHGVPGGFLSMMAISLLNNYSSDLTKETPAEILEKIREQVKINLGNNNEKVQDGFDIGLATFNTKNNELLYAGANISAYIVRGNELYTLNSVRNPIGNYPLEKNFENRNLKIRKEDIMYLSTDGYVDQFGEKGKYTNKRFKKFILEHSNLHLKQQKILFEKEFLEWKGNQTQVDDITVIAIKFLH